MQGNQNNLQLKQIQIKNFRCFSQTTLDLDGPLVLIQGANGSGKTSLLEALHYLCYLRSFRTYTPRDLIQFGADNFFIKATMYNNSADHMMPHEVQVGFSGKKRLVKINQKAISSYKELMDYYRIITLTEDDLELISAGPEIRRAFIDQALLLDDPEFITTIRNFKQIVDNRNALLMQGSRDRESYQLWTEQLLATSRLIQMRRMVLLDKFEQETNQILQEYFNGQLSVSLSYMPKKIGPMIEPEAFQEMQEQLHHEEMRFGRSLFGAHLDDFIIRLQDKKSKNFASRGQQKLIVVLMKIAQIKQISAQKGSPVFLLDDFMTDFDPERAEILLEILSTLRNQLIFTSPASTGHFEDRLRGRAALQLKLTY